MLDKRIGYELIKLNEVDSTNSFAARLLADEQIPEGTAILSQYQNAGKGQRSSAWESDYGKNLLVSFILYPDFLRAEQHFELNQIISLSVMDCIQSFTKSEVKIKWPNDIIVNERKISGILIENAIRGNRIKSTIAGIGINVNQTVFNKFEPIAGSLQILEQSEFSLTEVYYALCKYLNKWYTILQSGQTDKIISVYKNSLYRINEEHYFETKGVKFSGIIKGVTDEGKLIIEHTKEKVIQYSYKEVKFIFD